MQKRWARSTLDWPREVKMSCPKSEGIQHWYNSFAIRFFPVLYYLCNHQTILKYCEYWQWTELAKEAAMPRPEIILQSKAGLAWEVWNGHTQHKALYIQGTLYARDLLPKRTAFSSHLLEYKLSLWPDRNAIQTFFWVPLCHVDATVASRDILKPYLI